MLGAQPASDQGDGAEAIHGLLRGTPRCGAVLDA